MSAPAYQSRGRAADQGPERRPSSPLPTGAVGAAVGAAIRCDHDGLKMAEVQEGHLVLRAKHHGHTHVKVISLAKLLGQEAPGRGG